MTLYGIKNCGTVKKAIAWLNSHNIPFEFYDYKKQGISESKLQEWSRQLGIDNLINRKGTTWRKLDEEQKESTKSEQKAIMLMVANTSLIKRPLIEENGKVLTLGFDENEYVVKFVS